MLDMRKKIDLLETEKKIDEGQI